MTYRVFVNVNRGTMDATAVTVFPWEVRLLEEIHGEAAKLTTVDEMSAIRGSVKLAPLKMPFNPEADKPKTVAQQMSDLQRVSSEDDPFHDLNAEYERLVNLYGMDKELPMPVVKKVYGSPAQFAAAIRVFRKGSLPPDNVDSLIYGIDDDSGLDDGDDVDLSDMAPSDMTINQLRKTLKERGVSLPARATRDDLVELLSTKLAEAA